MIACETRSSDVVDVLVREEKLNMNMTNNHGATALVIACSDSDSMVEIVSSILERSDTQLDIQDDTGKTALIEVCAHPITEKAPSQVAKLLIEKGADMEVQNNSNMNALMMACSHANVDIVKVLLASDELIDINKADDMGYTAFNDLVRCRTLCRKGRFCSFNCASFSSTIKK